MFCPFHFVDIFPIIFTSLTPFPFLWDFTLTVPCVLNVWVTPQTELLLDTLNLNTSSETLCWALPQAAIWHWIHAQNTKGTGIKTIHEPVIWAETSQIGSTNNEKMWKNDVSPSEQCKSKLYWSSSSQNSKRPLSKIVIKIMKAKENVEKFMA